MRSKSGRPAQIVNKKNASPKLGDSIMLLLHFLSRQRTGWSRALLTGAFALPASAQIHADANPVMYGQHQTRTETPQEQDADSSPQAAMPAQAITRDSVGEIVKKMKEAFEPSSPSTRKVEITASDQNGEQSTWIAHQAREQQADGKRTLLVMEEPENTRGDALLIRERQGQPNA